MRLALTALCLSALVLPVFAQSDRGTITGTVADSSGAVVANAAIEARNTETGATYAAQSTATGNFTLAQLPAGNFEISVTVAGFKKYVRQGLAVQVAQTLRVDVALEVGAATESVTVTEAATLLKTESGELSHNVTSERLNTLPILGIGNAGAGNKGVRNPLNVTQLAPGTYYEPNSNLRVNGSPSNTQSIRVEGMEASNGYVAFATQQTQASVDAIQELSIQTSNFSAEFGQVGGGLFNFTMKSGTNQFHGSGYDYFVNEALNAGQPFTNDGRGNLLRSVQRRNDFGFTIGGPVWIPKVYDGHDKSFFFVNWEQFRETQVVTTQAHTVPTLAYRSGDFRSILTQRTLATDPLGRPILENTIYDPATQRLAPNGAVIRDPFANNTIPPSSFDPVARKVQELIPLPGTTSVINNLYPSYRSPLTTTIPAVKIDHILSSKAKVSFYWSKTDSRSTRPASVMTSQADGFPNPIAAVRQSNTLQRITRLNFDYTISPTFLAHFGAGYQDFSINDRGQVIDYDSVKELGLRGGTIVRQFPQFLGLQASQGGVQNLGPGTQSNDGSQRPTFNASVTWVKNNHTIKAGADFRVEGFPARVFTNVAGTFTFAAGQTGLPSTNGQNLSGGSVGFPYASFLAGSVSQVVLNPPENPRLGKHQLGMYIQDTWKATRKLSIDYGLRYDYSTYWREQYGRAPSFSPSTPNPVFGGQPGAPIYEGSLAGHCQCLFAKNYPFGFGPRLGIAYQITSKTVFRAGFGVVYDGTPTNNQSTSRSAATNFTLAAGSVGFGEPVMTLRAGIPFKPVWPSLDPGQFPALANNLLLVDQNAGRPPRQIQWSIGLQREIFRNLVVEASYVANRGAWWQANNLVNVNALAPERIRQAGLNIDLAADRTLLTSLLSSSTAVNRGFGKPPFPGFPLTATVAQSLRPFPQFGTIANLWAPLGSTAYDSLQTKVTKRFSHGLDFTYTFTWSKSLETMSGTNDVLNRKLNKTLSSFDQPLVSVLAANYTLPVLSGNRILSWAVRDWQIGGVVQYASGRPIPVPSANNALASLLFRGTTSNRVPGEPLFTQDLNCHCFDPNTTFVLNPKAWSDPVAGQWGTAAPFYTDYRYQRRPNEAMSIGRRFRIKERVTLSVRAEWTNILNRTYLNNPTVGNAQATQVRAANSQQTVSGFGFINNGSTFSLPRQGTIVARIQF